MIEKQALRKEFKAKRAQLKNENSDADRIIFEKLTSDRMFIEAKCIFCYISYNSEIATDKILEYILECGKTLVVPKCTDRNGNMIAVKIESLNEIEEGMYGIKEPVSDTFFDKEKIDLAVIPGLGYDKNGFRLGYGKGYYDRFLENSDIKTIGICHKELVCENIPHDKYDISVNKVITD